MIYLGNNATHKIQKVVVGFLALAFLVYVVIYLTLLWSANNTCVDVFSRPHEQHRIRIRSKKMEFPFNELEPNDYEKLVNFTHFKFIHNHENICTHLNVFLLVIIPSAPKNKEKRQIIRKTWGDKDEDIKVVFMLGLVNDEKLQKALEKENRLYGDIVQGNFIDAYHNMTYKSVMSLKFAIYFCPEASYILKVDDDSFVNIPLLKNFLKHDVSPFGAENLFLCNDMTGSPAIRDNTSKWYVSKEDFPDEAFPSYCSGWYAIFSPDVCFKLYREAQKVKYLFIDDALVYGIAAGKAKLKHTDMSFFTLAYRNRDLVFNGTYDKLPLMFGSPNMDPHSIKKFYEYFENKPVPQSVYRRLGDH